MVVLDSRPFDEYSRVSIPTGINVPGAELVLRVRDIAPSPDTHHRGQLRRPHPQHHRRAVADQCRRAQQGGGAAQRHHGLASRRLDLRPRQERPLRRRFRRDGLAWAKAKADAVARRFGVARIDRAALDAWRSRRQRARLTSSTCAIRPNTRPAICPGAISAPGGQLVQATDIYAGTLGARIVLCDDNEVRALMTASWLKQMGWQRCRRAAGSRRRNRRSRRRRCSARRRPTPRSSLRRARARRRDGDRSLAPARITGAAIFPAPGSPSAPARRARLPKIPPRGDVVLTSEDGVLPASRSRKRAR